VSGGPAIPRPEHPRPQFVRPDWVCLNGEWEFEIDAGDSGLERGLLERPLRDRILVPFCPESPLSGIGNEDFMEAVWYRRAVTIPAGWEGRRPVLHFGAVDHDATVWAGGVEVGRHRGGWTPFSADLSAVASAGETVTIVVRSRDSRHGVQARGKQARTLAREGVVYTRTTGIWQTVWLEAVPTTAMRRPRLTPDLAAGRFRLEQSLDNPRAGLTVRAVLIDAAGEVCAAQGTTGIDFSVTLDLDIPADRVRAWSPQDPHLYQLDLSLRDPDGVMLDAAASYAGMRGIAIDGRRVLLNGEPVFQRLVLDQGYYRDGILTAPDDSALVRDIEMSLAAGFNGARLHQKVFEERFLYHADRLGYLVWGEFGDWGSEVGGPHGDNQQPTPSYIAQWLEALERDYSHPCIIGWCGLNETGQALTDRITVLDDVTRAMLLAARAADRSRPVLDTSGWSHRVAEADIYDAHDYTQDPAEFAQNHGGGAVYVNRWHYDMSIPYGGQPYFLSEFGGIRWELDPGEGADSSMSGPAAASLEEFYDRFEKLCGTLLDNPGMFGYCYTQLTDVYQEQNGIYRFDRSAKYDVARLREIQTRIAAIENPPTPAPRTFGSMHLGFGHFSPASSRDRSAWMNRRERS
jgi:beta-galactosidase/beta-glucuronidase